MDVENLHTKDHLLIDTSNYADKDGYRLKVVNTLGNTLFETPVTCKEYEVELHQKYIFGNLFLEILDKEGNIMDVTKVR